jgi:single-stranded DNA-binding protein
MENSLMETDKRYVFVPEAKDEFLLYLLETEEARLTWKKESSNESETPKQEEQPKEAAPKAQAPAPAAANSTPTPSDDDDDLPF